MEKFILVTSFLALHYPFGLFRDTARRFENLCKNTDNPNYISYCLENLISPEYAIKSKFGTNPGQNPILKLPFATLTLLISLFVTLLPLFKLLNWNWYWIILLNLLFTFVISQIFAFLSTPHMKIYNIGFLKIKSIIYIIIGLVLYGITFLF